MAKPVPLIIVVFHFNNGLLLPPGNIIQKSMHATLPGECRPQGSAKEIKISRMGDFGVWAEGFKLEVAVVKPLAGLVWIFQDKLQSVLPWVEYIQPPKSCPRLVGQFVLYDHQILLFSDDCLLLDIFVGRDEITMKISLESPEHFNWNGHDVDHFVGLSTSRFRLDPINERFSG